MTKRTFFIIVVLFVALSLAGLRSMAQEKAIAATPKGEIKFEPSDVAEISEIQTARKARLDQLQTEIEKVNTEAGQKIMVILNKYGYHDGMKQLTDTKGHWLGLVEPEVKKP